MQRGKGWQGCEVSRAGARLMATPFLASLFECFTFNGFAVSCYAVSGFLWLRRFCACARLMASPFLSLQT